MTQHGTGISWTHAPGYKGEVWNPTTGCTRVSAGCDHCYAFTLHDQRYVANLKDARPMWGGSIEAIRANSQALPFPAQYDRPFSQVQLLPDRLDQPLHWRKPRAIFVDSMSDLFHDDVPDAYLDRVWATMALTPQHIFMVLTKRPERMREYVSGATDGVEERADFMSNIRKVAFPEPMPWPLPNVWLGVSVEDQAAADERIPLLLDTPAAVRFISAEPLLGPITLDGRSMSAPDYLRYGGINLPEGYGAAPKLDWVIVGGESGPGWRGMDPHWAMLIKRQCDAAGVAYFGKQGAGARSGIALPSPLNEQAWPEVTA